MSFSSDVKEEIIAITGEDRHCRIAQMAAIINACGIIKVNGDKLSFQIRTENKYLYETAFYIISNDFKYLIRANENKIDVNNKKITMYTINIDDIDIVKKILWATGILDKNTNEINFKIDGLVTKSSCCKRAYIRSTFINNGSINDPQKSYHLEFVFTDEKYSVEFSSLVNYFGLTSKVVARKENFVVYLKEAEQIVDILNIMGAHNSLLSLENLRIQKEILNNINRKVNFQSANLNKTIMASVKQVEDIELISNTKGLTCLSPQLEEIARLRLEYPEITLKELGEILSMPLGKSGVNHRLRKISQIADEIRNDI